jgi:hypothetical protein
VLAAKVSLMQNEFILDAIGGFTSASVSQSASVTALTAAGGVKRIWSSRLYRSGK